MRLSHRTFLALLSGIFFPLALALGNDAFPQEELAKAEEYYRSTKYQDALNIYEQLLGSDGAEANSIDRSALFFNAGTSAHRLGNLGLAKYFYLSGLRLSPLDSDLQQNMRKLEEKLRQQAFYVRADTFLPFEKAPVLYLLADWWLPFCLFLLLLHGMLVLNFRGLRPVKGLSLGLVALAFALVPLGAKVGWVKTAIVSADEDIIRSGPGEAFPELAKIGAGSSVRVRAAQGNWWKVSFVTQNSQTPTVGWVENKNLRSQGE